MPFVVDAHAKLRVGMVPETLQPFSLYVNLLPIAFLSTLVRLSKQTNE
jgi:hypothetical protein